MFRKATEASENFVKNKGLPKNFRKITGAPEKFQDL